MPIRNRRFDLLPVVLLLITCSGTALGADFVGGDLYLISRALADPAGSMEGIAHIEPVAATSTLLYEATGAITAMLAHDPFRDRLVFREVNSLLTIDADGNTSTLLPTCLARAATARGDGIIYLYYDTGRISYIDAADVEHDLLDETGTAPFNIGFQALNEILYDETTDAIIGATGTGTQAGCSWADACAVKIPLTAGGTQVAGPTTSVSVDVSGFEQVVGLSHTPTGGIAVCIDPNSNALEDRFQLLDPQNMTLGVFASAGGFTGSAAAIAGTYSTALDAVVVDDTFFDVLRAYAQGASGEGVILSLAGQGTSSTNGHSEDAQLIEIAGSTTSAPPARPAASRFHPPHPNPFNPATTLVFEIDRPQQVALDIYDLQGRWVRSLLNARLEADRFQSNWDGRDQSGAFLPSGVYFARLSLEGRAFVRRLALIR
ncbi:T9SS type A sorting domain-containing protein [bacterium]|nr:T9SS type A sorting domain-containing protein [bacterium]